MAVNLLPPDPAAVYPVAGIELGFAKARIKKWDRHDVMLMRLAPGTRVAGVFTQNAFAAAPVQVCREHLKHGDGIRALVVNAGNANCGTGEQGLAAARETCRAVGELLQCAPEQVLPFSTGVILEHLPVDKIRGVLPAAVGELKENAWATAAAAIMTTDTVAKAVSERVEIDGVTVTVTGIAKGVGMLQPNMATMLAYVATDAKIAQPVLDRWVKEVADASFNRVTIDGDTSTNDSFVLLATGKGAHAEIRDESSPGHDRLRAALIAVAQELAIKIARDGEGATKLITIEVEGAKDADEAHRVGKFIAHSPLVKTAFFASDPNLGRLIMAVGNAVPDLNTAGVSIWLGDVLVVDRGGRASSYTEDQGAAVMKPAEITVKVMLSRGGARTTVWTCDYSYDYVKINAEYRT
ncbi:MAG TPA: bifunctional glutamate N-acetyltransferase/amino-acid acetyltransferase ArgJ [Burkholderiaceae bacterium]|nr:bifunctional glutamate N-acetyltransferase/amino-acid acetyltransferase ArgJ [Burkholderiaceae bacterium]